MQTYKITLEYDGTDFVGWQSQKNGRAVQDVVEASLQQILQEQIRIVGGGRTDAGVHALGQVASFQTDKVLEPATMRKKLTGVLPEDVVVVQAENVAGDFHARYSAKLRRYKYYIMMHPTAIWRRYCWWTHFQLDHTIMSACAEKIVGEHDFQSFSKADAEVNHFRCTVSEAIWRLKGETLEFDITANRFLYGMVRALVGTMVEIGRGYRPFEDFDRIMEARDRKAAGMSAPPHGLFLREIMY